jgi:hypothetical protein
MIMIGPMGVAAGLVAADGSAPALVHAVRTCVEGRAAYCGAGPIVESVEGPLPLASPSSCPKCVAQLVLDHPQPSTWPRSVARPAG